MASRHNGDLAWLERSRRAVSALEQRELRLASQNKKQLVTSAVELPRRAPLERGDTASATVESEGSDRALWLGIQAGKVDLRHLDDRFAIEVVDGQHVPPRESLCGTSCSATIDDGSLSTAAAIPVADCPLSFAKSVPP